MFFKAPKPGSCRGAPVYTVSGCTPGARVWKVSLVTTCKPASRAHGEKPMQSDVGTALQGLTLNPGLNREPTAPASDATMMPLHGRSTAQQPMALKTHTSTLSCLHDQRVSSQQASRGLTKTAFGRATAAQSEPARLGRPTHAAHWPLPGGAQAAWQLPQLPLPGPGGPCRCPRPCPPC